MSSKKEVWKPIAFAGKKPSVAYAVSSHGRFGVMQSNGKISVRSIKPQPGGHRYNYKINGQSASLFVHKEVAKAFVKKPSPKHSLVIRKDHDYTNDHSDNLKWVTTAEHKTHVTFSPNAVKARSKKAIFSSTTAKVFTEKTAKQAKEMIWDPKRKLTFKQIAQKFGVSEMQIYRLKSGELWFHIKVDHEPVHKKYRQNLQNMAYQQKHGSTVAKENKKLVKQAKKTLKKLKGK